MCGTLLSARSYRCACIGIVTHLAILHGGCVPEKVAWLPDSSGFVFTANEHRRIVHYDVNTNSWRVVVEDSETNTPWPAVSPDGKSIAVARAKTNAGHRAIQIVIYDFSGNLLRESKEYVWQKDDKIAVSAELDETALAWCPTGRRLLVYCADETGIYDLKSESLWSVTSGAIPFHWASSPIRPDGAGFLLFHTRDAAGHAAGHWELVFRTWEGAEKAFAIPDAVKERFRGIVRARWHDRKMMLTCADGQIELDTSEGTFKLTKSSIPQDLLKKVSNVAIRADHSVLLRCRVTNSAAGDKAHIEALALGEAKPRVIDLLSEISNEGVDPTVTFCESPDSKSVAILGSHESSAFILWQPLTSAGRHATTFPRDGILTARLGQASQKSLPESYKTLGKHLGFELSDGGLKRQKPKLGELFAEYNAAILELKAIKSTDPETKFLANESADAYGELVASAKNLERLPRPPGANDRWVENFWLGFLGQTDRGLERSERYEQQSESIRAEFRKTGLAFQRLDGARRLLPRIAARHAGPPVKSGQAVIIQDYYGHWGPLTDDVVELMCNIPSGTELHNCTLLVTIEGASGETANNVHFLPSWKSGQTYSARYAPGMDFGITDSVNSQTVDDISRVMVSIWSDELTQTDIVLPYTAAKKTRTVRSILANAQLGLRYQSFKPGFLGSNRGVVATLSGLAYLPRCTVTVTFRDGEQNDTRQWSLDDWQNGNTKTFASQDFRLDPQSITVAIGFPDTDYVHYSHLDVREAVQVPATQ